MTRFTTAFVVAVTAVCLSSFLVAQEPERRRGQDRPRGGEGEGERGGRGQGQGQRGGGERGQGQRGGGERGGRGGQRAPSPIIAALDADGDGVISTKEMENAVAALKKLDKNGDGKLTEDEIRPQGSFGGRGGFGGGSGGQGGRGGSGGGSGGGGGDFIARLMENDADKDGKLSKSELPERMQQNMDRMDTNSDGFLDKQELEVMAQRFGGGGRGGQGGPGGRRGGAGGEGGRRGGDSDRPDRPQRPGADDDV